MVYRLLLNDYKELCLIATEWEERKLNKALFRHRPGRCIDISIKTFCERLNIQFVKKDIDKIDLQGFDCVLIAGAGILPDHIVENFNIINSHPGYLPNARGLDALKWAIYEGQPIGVTTHYISSEVDSGILIERKIIPVYFEDTFHSVANRIYENEIEMLVNAVENSGENESLKDYRYKSHSRMPYYLERIMIQRFEEIRKKSTSYLINHGSRNNQW